MNSVSQLQVNDTSSATSSVEPRQEYQIPASVRWGFTAFMFVLVPYYWIEYGPTNFVYFCDIALFLTLAAVWTEKRIYASIAAVGITLPQLIWQLDFLGTMFDFPLAGITGYMFNDQYSLFARGLSFFHFWLPMLLLYLVHRLGYDRRAFWGWTLISWAAMLVAYFLLPAPGDVLSFPTQPRNVNYVYGLSPDSPQTWMSSTTWLAILLAGLPLIVYLPTHMMLKRLYATVNKDAAET